MAPIGETTVDPINPVEATGPIVPIIPIGAIVPIGPIAPIGAIVPMGDTTVDPITDGTTVGPITVDPIKGLTPEPMIAGTGATGATIVILL